MFRAKYAEVFTKDPEALYHLNTMLSPVEVLRNHVPIYRTDQKPGEFIITFPKAYHAGFSHGFNCGEAVNIVDIEWLKFYKPAIQEYAKNGF